MLQQVGSVKGCLTGWRVDVYKVGGWMIVVLSDGEVCSLLDVRTEWIVCCAEDDVLYIVVS